MKLVLIDKDCHVAWLCYRKRNDNDQVYISVCDSDSPGAFKVYRELNITKLVDGKARLEETTKA